MNPWELMIELYGRASWYPVAGAVAFAVFAPGALRRGGRRRVLDLAIVVALATGVVGTFGMVLQGAPVRSASFEAAAQAVLVVLVSLLLLPILLLLPRGWSVRTVVLVLIAALLVLLPVGTMAIVMAACLLAGTCN